MEKRLFVQLNGNRKVIGILRGYDVDHNVPKMRNTYTDAMQGLLEHCARRRRRGEAWW